MSGLRLLTQQQGLCPLAVKTKKRATVEHSTTTCVFWGACRKYVALGLQHAHRQSQPSSCTHGPRPVSYTHLRAHETEADL
eukprot:4633931-Amphidinium_carterae.1